jgi:hypothetical protein
MTFSACLLHILWSKSHLIKEHRNHCLALEQLLGIVVHFHLQVSSGSELPEMELKMFHMLLWQVCILGWVFQKNIFIEFFVNPCLVDVQQSDDISL